MILLFGRDGQVGFELFSSLTAELGDAQIVAPTRQALDLSHLDQVKKILREVKPKFILNAAAYTNVEGAESNERDARRLNSELPALLAEEAKRQNAFLIHFSTDYIFDGTKRSPYVEEDIPSPLNVYGQTKLAGEKNIQAIFDQFLLFRLSWVYSLRRSNFVLKMIQLAKSQNEISVVDDQWGAPTCAPSIAKSILQILKNFEFSPSLLKEKRGIYHLSAGGSTTWFRFAERIFARIPARELTLQHLKPISSNQFGARVKRPLNSVLSNDKLDQAFGIRLESWEEQFDSMFRNK